MNSNGVRLRTSIIDPELGICERLNGWCRRPLVRALFRTVSRLGDGWAWYGLIVVISLSDGRDGAIVGVRMAAVGLICLILYRALKRWTRRPRPYARHRSIRAHIAPLDEFSFPSGHTLHATALSIVACAAYPALAWALVPFVALIALSRVVLGLHYPSDVLAALMIGAALGTSFLLL